MDLAISFIGKGEEGSNNSGEFIDMIFRRKNVSSNWCAAFVSYCFEEAYAKPDKKMPFARSGSAKKLYKNIGKYGEFTKTPKPGGVACWDRGKPGSWQGHIGIIESYDSTTKSFVCIEGNTGRYNETRGAVRRVEHSLDDKKLEGFAITL